MKNLQLSTTTIVVLLVFALSIFAGAGNSVMPTEFSIDKARSEGFVAFIVNEKSFDTEGGDVQNECECNGTKELIHGDGHKTPCPCSESPEGCQCRPAKPVTQQEVKQIPQVGDLKKKEQTPPLVVSQVVREQERKESGIDQQDGLNKSKKKQILFFTASWCGPCQSWKQKELARFKTNPKWKISEEPEAMIRIVDIDKPSNKQLMFNKQTRVVPEFVLMVNGKYKSHKTGYQSAETVGRMYNQW